MEQYREVGTTASVTAFRSSPGASSGTGDPLLSKMLADTAGGCWNSQQWNACLMRMGLAVPVSVDLNGV